jgi:pimeloyl-ACP methyl ester carboxylesterase
MLHGWADASATFQFLVDALGAEWNVIAPDWRGFGLSARTGDTYWFADYLGDLDALLAHFSTDQPAFILGHSMGGNVACLYAGIRPARVRKLLSMDAFGLPDRPPEQAPGRYEKWLNQLGAPQGFRSYPNLDAFANRLMRDNPRLDRTRATFLAAHLTEPDGIGGVRLAADPAHRSVHPVLYRRAEAESCWRRVRAPVMSIVQADPAYRRALGVSDEADRAAKACFADFREIEIADSGHNLHHDRPGQLGRIIEEFLLS